MVDDDVLTSQSVAPKKWPQVFGILLRTRMAVEQKNGCGRESASVGKVKVIAEAETYSNLTVAIVLPVSATQIPRCVHFFDRRDLEWPNQSETEPEGFGVIPD